MKELVLIFILCTLVVGLSFGQKKVVVHHTDLIDSPTSYVIPYGHVAFTLRMYPPPPGANWKGNGVLIKLRTAPFKNLCLGVSVKEDGLIACGSPPTPKVEDVGVLLRYKLLEEPISFTMGLDVIEYERWGRRRGVYTALGVPAKGYKNTIFPYLGGSAFFEKGAFIGGAFGGAEIAPIEGINLIIDWSWISEKGNFFDAGIRAKLAERLWLEFDVRDIEDIIRGGDEWNRMLRIWYEWKPRPPR